jgi:outer membrane murein-binding lipoprotein Lpp
MFASFLAWALPGGPILSAIAAAAGAVVSFLAKLLQAALDGLTKMVANPVTFVTAGLVALCAYAGGIHRGIVWDAAKVRDANAALAARTDERNSFAEQLSEAQAEIAQWKGRLDDQEKRASAADGARQVAEHKASAALAARDRALSLRDSAGKPAPKAGPQAAAGSGLLQGVQALFGGGQ